MSIRNIESGVQRVTMSSLNKILIDGSILSFLASLWLILALWVNPCIFLHDYPPKIREHVLQKTKAEKRLTYIFGVPFMLLLLLEQFCSTLLLKKQENSHFLPLWLNAAGVVFVFNLVDWLILNWLMFCTLTPHFLEIPGSEGMAEYKDYGFHFRGFLHGTVIFSLGGLLIVGIVSIL
jgi:hypothetical protein